jgi:hypothetical protein
MQTTGNTTPFIEAQQYSKFILENLNDGMLPQQFYRNVSDFQSGTTLNIKTVGTATIQDVQENSPIIYNPIDTGTVQLTITDYVGDAWYITDILRQDGTQIEQLHAMRAVEATRAIQENFETRFFSACNASQTAASTNAVNGFKHRWVASGTNNVITLDDFADMQLAFDLANVPVGGRIALVSPRVARTLNGQVSGEAFKNNPFFEGLVRSGFARDHQFVADIFGFQIWTSNRLAAGISETISARAVTNGVANVFMSISDDNTKPIMAAWRQMPKTEGGRNKDLKRDEYDVTARWGIGPQRVDTIGIVLTDNTVY